MLYITEYNVNTQSTIMQHY